jgi:hypothetical protein
MHLYLLIHLSGTYVYMNGSRIVIITCWCCVHRYNRPGATAVARRNTFVNIYIGWGLKYSSQPYTPPPPPTIQSEFVAEFNPEEGETDPLVEQVHGMILLFQSSVPFATIYSYICLT